MDHEAIRIPFTEEFKVIVAFGMQGEAQVITGSKSGFAFAFRTIILNYKGYDL